MKKLTLLCLMVFAAIASNAQISYTDLNPDSSYTISPSGTYSADSAIWLDIDGDSHDDFYFKYEYIVGIAGTTWKVQMHCIDTANQGYWKSTSTSFGNHYLKGLKKGDSITSNALFGSDYEPLLGDHVDQNMVGTGDKYIGIKFKSGTSTYYGWILINLSFGTSSGTLKVKEFAYNTTSGGSLDAGDTCLKSYSTTTKSDCDSLVWNGTTYYKSGTYTKTLTNSVGCDSIATLVLSINKTYGLFNLTACDSLTFNGITYDSSGIYTQTLTNSLGCDSILSLELTIFHPTDTTITIVGCDSAELNGTTYYNSGSYTQILTNSHACDSIINVVANIFKSTTSTVTVSACDSLVMNGATYHSSGNYTQKITNSVGCDSIISLTVNIKKSTTSNVSAADCDSVTLNGMTYTATGTYIQTLTNSVGCDSIISVNVTIYQPSITNLTRTACDSFTYNDSTYYKSGSYTHVFKDVKGCDSIVIVNLTINTPTTETITASACSSYTLNDSTYTQSGTYQQTVTNSNGCDSIITLVLTIGSLNKTVVQNHNTLTAQATGASYQWLDCDDGYSEISGKTSAVYTPTSNGNYAVKITDGACIDTSDCFAVTKVGIEYTNFPSSITAYPNPSNGVATINLGANYKGVTVTVYNALGERVSQKDYNNTQEFKLDIDGKPGVYFISINVEGYSAKIRIVKQ